MRYVQRVACPGSGGRPSIHSPASANSGVPYRTEAWACRARRVKTWQGYAIATESSCRFGGVLSRAIATTGAASPYTATSDATSSRLPRSAGSMCPCTQPAPDLTSLYGPDEYTARTARPDFFGRTPARPRALELFPRKNRVRVIPQGNADRSSR